MRAGNGPAVRSTRRASASPASQTRSSSRAQEAGRVSDGRRTQTVTWRQLHEASDCVGRLSCGQTPERRRGIAKRLAGACGRVPETIADICLRSAIEKRRHRRGYAVLGRGGAPGHREPPPDFAEVGEGGRHFMRRAALPERTRGRWRSRWISAFCLTSDRKLLCDRLSRRRGHARPELLRSARVGSAAGELHGHRQGRRSGPALVPPWPRRTPVAQRRGADLLVGVDVRIPDAVAGHARARRAACSNRRTG